MRYQRLPDWGGNIVTAVISKLTSRAPCPGILNFISILMNCDSIPKTQIWGAIGDKSLKIVYRL